MKCKHINVIEVGIIDCGYACKIIQCEKCGTKIESHRRIYGCPKGN